MMPTSNYKDQWKALGSCYFILCLYGINELSKLGRGITIKRSSAQADHRSLDTTPWCSYRFRSRSTRQPIPNRVQFRKPIPTDATSRRKATGRPSPTFRATWRCSSSSGCSTRSGWRRRSSSWRRWSTHWPRKAQPGWKNLKRFVFPPPGV